MLAVITLSFFVASNYWSSTENNANNAWRQNFSDGNQNNNNKTNSNYVRCVRSLLKSKRGVGAIIVVPTPRIKKMITLQDIFEAYYQCRKNKRNTINALEFEIDYEQKLIELHREIISGNYRIGKSIAFIVEKPVKREIFAGDFRDRIVHHLIINKFNPFFEKQFIYDSYSCRKGRGTHFGIKRAERFLRTCSRNYTQDCYILKLDISGFFMHINKDILYQKFKMFIKENYFHNDRDILLDLCKKVIYNNPTKNCVIKSQKSKWIGLPKSKSLFHTSANRGLPIGNFTSQVFANFYLDSFDHFIKHTLGIRHYGRYVDDFVIFHKDKEYLKNVIPVLRNFLWQKLRLILHPKKIYLQHYSKGAVFLGVFIRPYRTVAGKRMAGNFYWKIEKWNQIILENAKMQKKFLSSINSYLGIMRHYHSYKLRKKMLTRNLSIYFWNYAYIVGYGHYNKLALIKVNVK